MMRSISETTNYPPRPSRLQKQFEMHNASVFGRY